MGPVNHPNLSKFNAFRPLASLADKLHSPLCLPLRGQAGVPIDYFVRFHSDDADHSSERGSKEEANPSAVAHRRVLAVLRSDDHAHRRTGIGYPIAAQSH